jgi:hypothetical protein
MCGFDARVEASRIVTTDPIDGPVAAFPKALPRHTEALPWEAWPCRRSPGNSLGKKFPDTGTRMRARRELVIFAERKASAEIPGEQHERAGKENQMNCEVHVAALLNQDE